MLNVIPAWVSQYFKSTHMLDVTYERLFIQKPLLFTFHQSREFFNSHVCLFPEVEKRFAEIQWGAVKKL